jgi:GYF domain 2
MNARWYFSHGGITHGPFSESEIAECVAQKLIAPSDPLWPEGRDIASAAPAAAIFDFPKPPAVPDWLADVALVEAKGPLITPMPTDEIPEWLDDLRLWLGLDCDQPARAAPVVPAVLAAPPLPIAAPDGISTRRTPKAPETTQAPSRLPPTGIAMATPVAPLPGDKSSVPMASPVASCVPPAPPAPAHPPATKSADDFLVKKTRYESGFDLETGQILDAEKFRKWKQQQAPSTAAGQAAVSNGGLLEVFRKGRFAIESWVDDAANRAYVVKADIQEITRRPEVQAILREYGNYGDAIREKLLRHLGFVVENRRKYCAAIDGTRAHHPA